MTLIHKLIQNDTNKQITLYQRQVEFVSNKNNHMSEINLQITQST